MTNLSQTLSRLRRQNASPKLVLVIVCAGVVMASLDLFIVNLALPDIGRDLGDGHLTSLSWVLNAYAIVYASLLVLLGRLSESHRRDEGFLLGTVIFTAASAACGAATSLPMLIGFRIVQAAGAALLTPTSLSLVLATARPDRRAGSVRAWTAMGGLAATLGPVIGGLLVALSWRWVFFVNVPIGLAAVIVGWRRLPAIQGQPIGRPDALGAFLLTAGVGALTLGLVEGNSWGWGGARVLGCIAAAVVLLAAFVIRTTRHDHPLIDPSLFRIRAFSGASVVSLLFSISFGAMILSIVLWEQQVWHWSPLHSGLAIAPGPLMVPLVAFLFAGRLIARFGAGAVIVAGATVFGAGAVWWALAVGLHPNYLGEVLGGMILTGVGVGLTLPTYMSAGASALPPQSFATGSGALNMLRQVGLAVGVAVLVAVLGAPDTPADALAAFRDGWIMVAGVALLSALAAGLLMVRRPALATRTDATPSAPVTVRP